MESLNKSTTRIVISALLLGGLTACGGGGSEGGNTAPAPSVTLSSSSSSVPAGDAFTLTWSSSNATSCSASGAWSGSKSTSGSEEVTEANPANNTYTISCSGGGGSGRASTDVEITDAMIRIDESDLSYRVPEGGDLFVYDFQITASDYSFGLISEQSDSGTMDLEYFSTSLPATLAEAWSGFEVRKRKLSVSGGIVDVSESTNRAYGTRVYDVSDDEGFYVLLNDEGAFYGSTALPPLVANSSFSENWEFRYDDDRERRYGVSTFTVSGIEVLDTAIGRIEAFRISTETSEELYSKSAFSGNFSILDEVSEGDIVAWIHPKFGLLRYEAILKTDDTPSSDWSYTEGKLTYEIRSTNVSLPQ